MGRACVVPFIFYLLLLPPVSWWVVPTTTALWFAHTPQSLAGPRALRKNNYFLEPISGRPARHGSASEKHYLCDQLQSATRGTGVDTDGPKFERRGLAVQIRGRRSPKPYLNGFQKFSIVKSRLTARPRRSNRAQAIAYLRFERRGLAVQIGLRRSPTSDLNGEASPFKSERRDFNLDPNK